ncbi:CBS domain-containing protein [Streptomyces sp. NPDC006551]|uniref:CBS domain-containing protein n=1 Tax=Streptomyces sp. NPDC006551 TaxID=3157178 RepID=UPI0033BF74DD
MTPVQTHPRPSGTVSTTRTVADTMEAVMADTMVDAMDETGPQVWDDMTVEVALSVMASARAAHLIVRDNDGRCTGLVTRAQLAAVHGSSAYTDRLRLREITGAHGPFTSPVTTMAEAERAMRHGRGGALPVVDEHGRALGVLHPSR